MRGSNDNLYNDHVLYGRRVFGYWAVGISLVSDLLDWGGAFDTNVR